MYPHRATHSLAYGYMSLRMALHAHIHVHVHVCVGRTHEKLRIAMFQAFKGTNPLASSAYQINKILKVATAMLLGVS